jgi:large subunit ribosomal protein L30
MPESTKKASGRKTKASAAKAKKKAPGTTTKSTKAAAKPAKEATPAMASTAKAPGVVQIKLVRSLIGSSPRQRAVVAGLGLRRLNQTVERKDTREVRGMVAKVPHLVNILS